MSETIYGGFTKDELITLSAALRYLGECSELAIREKYKPLVQKLDFYAGNYGKKAEIINCERQAQRAEEQK